MTTQPAGPVAHLASISLAELNAAAALQERVDRKYVLTEERLAEMVDELGRSLAVLDIDGRRSFGYQSVYFDTETFESYRGDTLRPTLTTQYRRTTLVDLADVARLTIDFDLRCSDWTSEEVLLADRVVVETKSSGAPSAADRWLWSRGMRPEKISKFGTCLAALHPELPSNKWHRTLDRHFGTPVPSPASRPPRTTTP
jgi:hypothetical protein